MTSKDNNTLFGLVLAGGHSKRMGADKSTMRWHGKEQRYYMADMLAQVCDKVFISCRPEQADQIDSAYHALPDNAQGSGPVVGILSALNAFPDQSWLVVACDLPLLDRETIGYLTNHRDKDSVATTFESPFDGLPEPLITIWEPASQPILVSHLEEGFSCPRKALIRNQDRVTILQAPDPEKLMNANTPEDAAEVRRILEQK